MTEQSILEANATNLLILGRNSSRTSMEQMNER